MFSTRCSLGLKRCILKISKILVFHTFFKVNWPTAFICAILGHHCLFVTICRGAVAGLCIILGHHCLFVTIFRGAVAGRVTSNFRFLCGRGNWIVCRISGGQTRGTPAKFHWKNTTEILKKVATKQGQQCQKFVEQDTMPRCSLMMCLRRAPQQSNRLNALDGELTCIMFSGAVMLCNVAHLELYSVEQHTCRVKQSALQQSSS